MGVGSWRNGYDVTVFEQVFRTQCRFFSLRHVANGIPLFLPLRTAEVSVLMGHGRYPSGRAGVGRLGWYWRQWSDQIFRRRAFRMVVGSLLGPEAITSPIKGVTSPADRKMTACAPGLPAAPPQYISRPKFCGVRYVRVGLSLSGRRVSRDPILLCSNPSKYLQVTKYYKH